MLSRAKPVNGLRCLGVTPSLTLAAKASSRCERCPHGSKARRHHLTVPHGRGRARCLPTRLVGWPVQAGAGMTDAVGTKTRRRGSASRMGRWGPFCPSHEHQVQDTVPGRLRGVTAGLPETATQHVASQKRPRSTWLPESVHAARGFRPATRQWLGSLLRPPCGL